MEFNLMDSSFHNKPDQSGIRSMNIIHLDKFQQLSDGLYPESSESSDLEFSGGGGAATPTHFHNAYTLTPPPPPFQEMKLIPYFAHNIETTNFTEFPCTTPSLQKRDSMEAMREMIFRMAMMQPVHIEPELVKPPKRKNVRISKDPQSVAARHRRERISHRIRILQRMVPGGTKLDTASMLEEAVHYMKFLKRQVQTLEQAAAAGNRPTVAATGFFPVVGSMQMLS